MELGNRYIALSFEIEERFYGKEYPVYRDQQGIEKYGMYPIPHAYKTSYKKGKQALKAG
jgi:hypothetical protein